MTNAEINEMAVDQIWKITYDFDEAFEDNKTSMIALLGEVRGISWLARELTKEQDNGVKGIDRQSICNI